MVCTACGRDYALDDPVWKCLCGGLLDIELDARFPREQIEARKPTMWRYREAIPVGHEHPVVTFDEGFTPLLPVEIAGRRVLIKQDHLLPTGSYKDRGASVLISKARSMGVKRVVEDSSGNAGCAIAAYCAAAQIECAIYVPSDTSPGKLAHISAYGATLQKIPGSREDTAHAVLAAAARDYYASHSWNPFFFHGTKTWAFEVCEQLGWKAPDTIVLPVGNGTLLLGAYIGFNELVCAEVTEGVPKIVAVQAANCNPLSVAFRRAVEPRLTFEQRETLAEGIAIAEPVRGKQIVDAVRWSGGTFIDVTEEEIESAWREMGRKGFYIEPTSAATIAGLIRYAAGASPDEVIVSVFTGHGLKSTEKTLKLLDH